MSTRVRAVVRLVSLSLIFVLAVSSAAPPSLAHHTESNPVRIDALDVTVSIDHHFATTHVRETLTNPSSSAIEFVAALGVPDLSFVTRFALETGGHTYESRIEDAAAARAAYDAAAASSSAAAIVEGRGTHTYEVSLNLPASSTVVVHLSFEQLVTRTGAAYEYRFPLVASTGGKPVGLLSVEGSLTGSAAVLTSGVTMGALHQPSSKDLDFFHHSSHLVQDADYVLTWTEGQPASVGAVFTHATPEGGTFVHAFSPEFAGVSLAPMPKDIVFVLDTSGSMHDSIDQVKQVFSAIISDLRDGDRFSVVEFASSTSRWAAYLSPATPASKASAVSWVSALEASGATNLGLGLSTALSMFEADPARANTLVLLSDGEPTDGITDSGELRADVRARNTNGAALYGLAFGPDADFDLVRALSLENSGEARRIWLGQDAGAQIRGFYDTIATPLLCDVTISYPEGVASPATVHYARAFQGADLVSSGTLLPGATTITVSIDAASASGPLHLLATMEVASTEAGAFVERAWAFERVRALTPAAVLGDTSARADLVSTALGYSFVTDFTSLVVVVPPVLSDGTTVTPMPLRVTSSSVLVAQDTPPLAAPYAATPPRATPGPGALLAALGLAGAGLVAARRRRSRL